MAARKVAWRLPNGETVYFPRGYRQLAALRRVRRGRALLDVGCGRGAVAAALSERFHEVHGVDARDADLTIAAARGVKTARVDLENAVLPFPDARFDAVLCLEVVEHVVAVDRLVRELARILEPGGRLYLSTPNVRFVGYLVDLVVRGRFPLTSGDPHGWQGGHIHFFTFRDIDELLARAGFTAVAREGLPTRRMPLPREFGAPGIFVEAVRGAEIPPQPAADTSPRVY